MKFVLKGIAVGLIAAAFYPTLGSVHSFVLLCGLALLDAMYEHPH